MELVMSPASYTTMNLITFFLLLVIGFLILVVMRKRKIEINRLYKGWNTSTYFNRFIVFQAYHPNRIKSFIYDIDKKRFIYSDYFLLESITYDGKCVFKMKDRVVLFDLTTKKQLHVLFYNGTNFTLRHDGDFQICRQFTSGFGSEVLDINTASFIISPDSMHMVLKIMDSNKLIFFVVITLDDLQHNIFAGERIDTQGDVNSIKRIEITQSNLVILLFYNERSKEGYFVTYDINTHRMTKSTTLIDYQHPTVYQRDDTIYCIKSDFRTIAIGNTTDSPNFIIKRFHSI